MCANAGVDASNASEPDTLVVLPRDPDASARRIRARLHELTGARVAVLVTDSFGRAWRHGQLDTAIGLAGMAPLEDWRGRTDASGLELRATWLAVADAATALAIAATPLSKAIDARIFGKVVFKDPPLREPATWAREGLRGRRSTHD